MPRPLNFDFITDEQLRASLDSDHRELQSCLENGAWKAAHVMSGSIVEALLVDYLLGASYATKDPLKMTMADLIDAGKVTGVLTDRTASLSSVIREYRNLIHPGRVVRLEETVTEEGARIADAVVSLIVGEVSAKQAQVYGLTAEQLLTKFETDPRALAISDHLLRDTQPRELERLLLTVLPERYFVLSEQADFEFDADADASVRLERLYVAAYDAAPAAIQRKTAKRFLTVLREDAGWRVDTYEEKFFRGRFLEHLSEPERRLVKDHIFSRMTSRIIPPSLIECVEGLSAYIRPGDGTRFFDALIRTVSYAPDQALIREATERIEGEFHNYLPEAIQPQLLTRLETWAEFHSEAGRFEEATRIENLRAQLTTADDDIPF